MAEPSGGSATPGSVPPARARRPDTLADELPSARGLARESRWFAPLVVVATLVTLLAALACLGVALMTPPAPQSFPPDSPSAALLAYVDAVRQGDYTRAESFISSRIKAENDAWQKLVGVSDSGMTDSDVRVVGESGDGIRAIVAVEVTHFYGSGLNRSSYVEQTNIAMVREADGWKIDSDDFGRL